MNDLHGTSRILDTERRQRVVAFVEEHQGATVAQLSEHFRVSEATVRRDLLQLSRQGRIERAHGGASPRRARHDPRFPEPPILDRETVMRDEKRRIGAAAAKHVADGDTIIVSGGTTTAHLIPHLERRKGLTVITNNLTIAGLLASMSQHTVILVGGVLRHSEMSLLGTLAEDALENLRVDKLFIGSSAVTIEFGLSADDPAEVQTDRAMMAVARDVVVLADHTKFNRIRTIRVAPIQRVSRVITDSAIAAEVLAALTQEGIPVDLA